MLEVWLNAVLMTTTIDIGLSSTTLLLSLYLLSDILQHFLFFRWSQKGARNNI